MHRRARDVESSIGRPLTATCLRGSRRRCALRHVRRRRSFLESGPGTRLQAVADVGESASFVLTVASTLNAFDPAVPRRRVQPTKNGSDGGTQPIPVSAAVKVSSGTAKANAASIA